MIFRSAAAACILLAVASLPARADDCQSDIAKIDAALASQQLDPDVRSQVEDQRSQAVQLCGAGNTADGLAVTAEVKAMLNLE